MMQHEHLTDISIDRNIAGQGFYDAIILSDIHLGSNLCQAGLLSGFLSEILENRIRTQQLVLNGDVFDSINFHRLSGSHWKVLSLLRRISSRLPIIWVCGNHDGPSEIVSHLLGVEVKEEHSFRSGRRNVLVMHGHVFDEFLYSHPVIGWVGDLLYRWLQKADRSHAVARRAKTASKTFLRCARLIREKAMRYAAERGFSMVICGHTHHAEQWEHDGMQYINSGCWTEMPGTFISIAGGIAELHEVRPSLIGKPADPRMLPVGRN